MFTTVASKEISSEIIKKSRVLFAKCDSPIKGCEIIAGKFKANERITTLTNRIIEFLSSENSKEEKQNFFKEIDSFFTGDSTVEVNTFYNYLLGFFSCAHTLFFAIESNFLKQAKEIDREFQLSLKHLPVEKNNTVNFSGYFISDSIREFAINYFSKEKEYTIAELQAACIVELGKLLPPEDSVNSSRWVTWEISHNTRGNLHAMMLIVLSLPIAEAEYLFKAILQKIFAGLPISGSHGQYWFGQKFILGEIGEIIESPTIIANSVNFAVKEADLKEKLIKLQIIFAQQVLTIYEIGKFKSCVDLYATITLRKFLLKPDIGQAILAKGRAVLLATLKNARDYSGIGADENATNLLLAIIANTQDIAEFKELILLSLKAGISLQGRVRDIPDKFNQAFAEQLLVVIENENYDISAKVRASEYLLELILLTPDVTNLLVDKVEILLKPILNISKEIQQAKNTINNLRELSNNSFVGKSPDSNLQEQANKIEKGLQFNLERNMDSLKPLGRLLSVIIRKSKNSEAVAKIFNNSEMTSFPGFYWQLYCDFYKDGLIESDEIIIGRLLESVRFPQSFLEISVGMAEVLLATESPKMLEFLKEKLLQADNNWQCLAYYILAQYFAKKGSDDEIKIHIAKGIEFFNNRKILQDGNLLVLLLQGLAAFLSAKPSKDLLDFFQNLLSKNISTTVNEELFKKLAKFAQATQDVDVAGFLVETFFEKGSDLFHWVTGLYTDELPKLIIATCNLLPVEELTQKCLRVFEQLCANETAKIFLYPLVWKFIVSHVKGKAISKEATNKLIEFFARSNSLEDKDLQWSILASEDIGWTPTDNRLERLILEKEWSSQRPNAIKISAKLFSYSSNQSAVVRKILDCIDEGDVICEAYIWLFNDKSYSNKSYAINQKQLIVKKCFENGCAALAGLIPHINDVTLLNEIFAKLMKILTSVIQSGHCVGIGAEIILAIDKALSRFRDNKLTGIENFRQAVEESLESKRMFIWLAWITKNKYMLDKLPTKLLLQLKFFLVNQFNDSSKLSLDESKYYFELLQLVDKTLRRKGLICSQIRVDVSSDQDICLLETSNSGKALVRWNSLVVTSAMKNARKKNVFGLVCRTMFFADAINNSNEELFNKLMGSDLSTVPRLIE